MRLTVTHGTTYRYARPVQLQPHRLVMTPRGTHDLMPLSSRLEITPHADKAWSQDVFGNLIATATFSAATDRLTIRNHMVVEQCAEPWPIFAITPSAHAYPFAYSDDERLDLGALLLSHSSDDEAVRRWAQAFLSGAATDTLSLLQAINRAIYRQIRYRARDEEGTQRPDETLALQSGSCRDMATLLIAAVRSLGFGARAVSGYLYTSAAGGPPDDAQHGATHAWAEIYLPGAGWIAFDPTNDRMGSADLVPVAVSRDLRQIMPVSGGYVGTPGDFLDMDVDVRVTATTPQETAS